MDLSLRYGDKIKTLKVFSVPNLRSEVWFRLNVEKIVGGFGLWLKLGGTRYGIEFTQGQTVSSVLNELFAGKVGEAEGKEKIAEYGGDYVQRRLREVSFARKIVPPKAVRPRKGKRDSLIGIVDTEPTSKGMAVTFKGKKGRRR